MTNTCLLDGAASTGAGEAHPVVEVMVSSLNQGTQLHCQGWYERGASTFGQDDLLMGGRVHINGRSRPVVEISGSGCAAVD